MTTAPDFTIAQILAWARTKPADEAYCYTLNGHCAVAQFLKDTGRAKRPSVGPDQWSDLVGDRRDRAFPPLLEDAVVAKGEWPKEEARTFGGLVRRLEALAQETIAPPSEWTRLDAYMADIETVVAQ